jgi:hypothetical protein
MTEIIQHLINYTEDELKEIYKTGEAFRKYPKNRKFVLDKYQVAIGKYHQ